jgi:beta-lactamase class A
VKRLLCSVVLISVSFAETSNPQTASPSAVTQEKQKVLWQKLEASVHDIDQHLDGVMGVAIEDLTTGDQFLLHENEVFAQASSIKIAVLAELYRQAQQGKLKLTDLYTVQASDLVADSNIMGGLTPGITRLTLRDLAMLDSFGLSHTRLRRKMMDLDAAKHGRENISTPSEMMTLLAALYRGKVLNKEMESDFFTMLSTGKDSWIPRDLPADLKIADKPGELEAVRNDSGIVFVEGRPYVICVMTAFLRNERNGEEAISKVSLAAWRMFDRLSRATEYGRVVSPGNGVR